MSIKTSIYSLLIALASAHAVHAQTAPISSSTGGEDSLETQEGFNAKTDELYFDALTAKRHEDDTKAIALLKQLVAARPQHAAGLFELTRIYAEKKEWETAIGYIKKAIAIDTTNKWYKETYANVLAARQNFNEAAAMFAQLAKSEPADPEYPVKAADNYERAGKNEEAMKYLDMALQRNVEDEELMQRKVDLYVAMNKMDKAGEVVQQMIANDPKNGKYYRLLGDLYDSNKMTEKAATLYQQALKKLPDDAAVQVGMAAHSLRKGDTANYRVYLKKAITNPTVDAETQITLLTEYIRGMANESTAMAEAMPIIVQLVAQDPNDEIKLAFYGEGLEGNDMKDSAAVIYKKALAIKPANFAVWGRLLSLYLEKPYADSMIKYSEKAMRLFPNQAIVHFYNGVGHMNKNQNSKAINSITRAIDLQPDTEKDALALMHSTLGDIYYTTKQYALSDEAFDKAMAIDPSNANVLNNYSYYLSERGVRLDDAEKMSKKSLDLRPGEGTYLDTYGWILYQKGNYKLAAEYIQKAIDAAKEAADGTLYNHLGDALYKLNEKEKAKAAWKKAKEKGSDDTNLDKKIAEGKL